MQLIKVIQLNKLPKNAIVKENSKNCNINLKKSKNKINKKTQ